MLDWLIKNGTVVDGTGARFMIGGMMLTFWLAYFFLYRPARPVGDSA